MPLGPSIGASSREPGRNPTQVSAIGSSSIAGTARQAPSISASKPPAVDPVVEAALLDGAADDQPAVVARHQIAARQPHDMAQQRRRRVHLQRQHLALDRPHRRQIGRRDAADLARPGAGREHDDIGRFAAAIGDDAAGAPAGDHHLADRAVLVQLDAGAAGRGGQRAAEPAVFDLVVARAQHRGGDAGLQMRLAPPRLGRRQPFEIEAEAFLEFVGKRSCSASSRLSATTSVPSSR